MAHVCNYYLKMATTIYSLSIKNKSFNITYSEKFHMKDTISLRFFFVKTVANYFMIPMYNNALYLFFPNTDLATQVILICPV